MKYRIEYVRNVVDYMHLLKHSRSAQWKDLNRLCKGKMYAWLTFDDEECFKIGTL